MKLIKYIYIVVLGICMLNMTACDDITQELDDYEPLYSLPAETAITNESSAELALVGIYSGFRQSSTGSGNPEIYIVPDIMSGYAQVSFYYSSRPENAGWIANDPVVENANTQTGIYTKMYDLVNRVNWFLESVNKLTDTDFDNPSRKEEMVAEAKTIRAVANFYLLRLYGQFYDVNSEYGITLRTEPAKTKEAFPRNTVAETYAAIHADLDAGAENNPDLRKKYYVNKTFASAFKAKVLLYQGDYMAAASLANNVLFITFRFCISFRLCKSIWTT